MIIKDPETLPEDFLEFQELYTNEINSPMIWIANTEEDLESPSTIILDGHSTILIYSTDYEDLSWEAFNQPGSYSYKAENKGDGVILFPHTFYMEFKINLKLHSYIVSSEFKGSGIEALGMPMNGVPIEKLHGALTDRLSNSFSGVLSKIEDLLEFNEGKSLKIPENSIMELGIKLALLGISYDKLRINEIIEHVLEDEEVFEKIYEPEEVKGKMKKEIKIKPTKTAPSKKKKAVTAAPPKIKKKSVVDASSALGGMPLPVDGKIAEDAPAPTPASKKIEDIVAKEAPKAPIPGAAQSVAALGPQTSPPKEAEITAPPPSTPKEVEDVAVLSAPVPSIPKAESKMDEIEEMEDMDEADEREEMIPSAVLDEFEELTEVVKSRYTNTSWFERMLPARAYPLLIKISTEELTKQKSIKSVITGEKVSEQLDEFDLETDDVLTIRPEFPGCMITPNEHQVDVTNQDIEVKFFVTPLISKGTINAKINFIQSGSIIHRINLSTKIINHRISRITAWLGAIAGIIPGFLAFYLNETPQTFMENRLETFLPALKDLGYYVPIALTGILFSISGLLYMLAKPQMRNNILPFPK
jgi:hypothetical protein